MQSKTEDRDREPMTDVSASTGPITIGAGGSTWAGASARPEFRKVRHERWEPNLGRLFETLQRRELDGLVAQLRQNVFYLSGHFSRGIMGRHENDSQACVIVSRHDPHHPILVVSALDADHVVSHPTWIEDVRPFVPYLISPDIPINGAALDRFMTRAARETEWGSRAHSLIADGYRETCRRALVDLGLTRCRVGFDNLSFASSMVPDGLEVMDAYSTMRYVRQVKTAEEVHRLRAAASLNEKAIANTISSWRRGMTWYEMQHIYDLNCVALGGYVQQEGGMVLANDESVEPVFHIISTPEDFLIKPGTSLLLDCHGMLDHYRWDGGKTWVVDDERHDRAALIQRACTEAAQLLMELLVPGMDVHTLQRRGGDVFRKLGVPDAERSLVFFHGMGLDNTDIEIRGDNARPNWELEAGMVIATHIAYPGEPRERFYLEDVGLVTPSGGESLYSWGLEPHSIR